MARPGAQGPVAPLDPIASAVGIGRKDSLRCKLVRQWAPDRRCAKGESLAACLSGHCGDRCPATGGACRPESGRRELHLANDLLDVLPVPRQARPSRGVPLGAEPPRGWAAGRVSNGSVSYVLPALDNRSPGVVSPFPARPGRSGSGWPVGWWPRWNQHETPRRRGGWHRSGVDGQAAVLRWVEKPKGASSGGWSATTGRRNGLSGGARP
jgi:hypothetical protein